MFLVEPADAIASSIPRSAVVRACMTVLQGIDATVQYGFDAPNHKRDALSDHKATSCAPNVPLVVRPEQ